MCLCDSTTHFFRDGVRMRILYLADAFNYRERGGHYYVDWMEVLPEMCDVTFWGPGLPDPDIGDFGDFDFMVFGHAAYRQLHKTGYPFGMVRGRQPADVFAQHFWGIDFRKVSLPKILMTQNDYGEGISNRIQFCVNERVDLVVTQTRAAVTLYEDAGVATEWLPFGVNGRIFHNLELPRDIDIGFRGNLNDKWNNGIRAHLTQGVLAQCADFRLSIMGSVSNESFLLGDDYVRWMNRCHLTINTVSANKTVGPKWWEQFACGCVPLGLEDEYEGMFRADIDYLCVKPDLSNLRSQVIRFFADDTFRERLVVSGQNRAGEGSIGNRAKSLLDLLVKRWPNGKSPLGKRRGSLLKSFMQTLRLRIRSAVRLGR